MNIRSIDLNDEEAVILINLLRRGSQSFTGAGFDGVIVSYMHFKNKIERAQWSSRSST
jgi:hypothetical protein